jgi:2Fe-2S ferredoxin
MRVQFLHLTRKDPMPKIKFMPSGIEVQAREGEALLDIALANDVSIQHACGGFCACTTCHCEILEGEANLLPPDEDELERLGVLDSRTPHSRLACQSKVKGDVVVRVVNPE